jgi:hypothetical protein
MPRKDEYALNLVFNTVLQADDGPRNADSGMIRSESELLKSLRHLAPLLSGSVNFNKEQLIFVAFGLRDFGVYEAQICSVIFFVGRGSGAPPLMEVMYRENSSSAPPSKEPVSNPTFPIHVVKVKKHEGVIVFKKKEKA